MRRIVRPAVISAVVGAAALAVAAVAVARVSTTHTAKIDVPSFSADQLSSAAGDDWIVTAGNLWGQRHSSLTDITTSNVTKLKQAFHVTLNSKRASDIILQLPGEANPLEYQGTVFQVDNVGHVYAIDATTGKKIWTYLPTEPKVKLPGYAKKGASA